MHHHSTNFQIELPSIANIIEPSPGADVYHDTVLVMYDKPSVVEKAMIAVCKLLLFHSFYFLDTDPPPRSNKNPTECTAENCLPYLKPYYSYVVPLRRLLILA